MILAVPTAAIVKILYDEFYTRPNRVPVSEIASQAQELVCGQASLEENSSQHEVVEIEGEDAK